MKIFGWMRKNFNIPYPNSQSPQVTTPRAEPNASPHANRLARPPRFPEIFEEDEAGSNALKDDRCQTRRPSHAGRSPALRRQWTLELWIY